MKDTLNLIHRPDNNFINGVYYTDPDHPGQKEALSHFSGGCIAICASRLDEIVYLAGMHGWSVTIENDPRR